MKQISQKFYEKTYHSGYQKKMPKGFWGRLYLILKKFALYREDVVLDLLPAGARLLDIGCGEGNLLFNAAKSYRDLYGVDIAKTRILIAREKLKTLPENKKQRFHFQIADADLHLPFKADYFDSVTMVAAFEHFFDPFHIINEVKRILKIKGILVIQVPNIGFLPRRLALLTGRLPLTSEAESGWDGGHLHYFTVSALAGFLEKSGFKIEKITCSGVLAGLRRWWVSLLGADIIIVVRKK